MIDNNTKLCLFSSLEFSRHGFDIKFTAIATSAIGLTSCFGSIFGNALVLFVLFKYSRLQIPSNILLGNLCITDLLTGLIVVPTISARRITEAYGNGICIIRIIGAYFSYLTIIVSIFTVGVISIDRYYAIMKPFRYQVKVNNKRYIVLTLLLWTVLGVYSSLPILGVISGTNFFRIACALMTIAIVVFTVCYTRIANVVVSQRRKVFPREYQTHTKSHIGERMSAMKRFSHNLASTPKHENHAQIQVGEKQRTNTIALVMFFAMICYGPLGIVFVLRGIMGDTFELVYLVDPWADLIMYLNSAINPGLYCLRAKDIRRAVGRTLPVTLRKLLRANDS